MQAALAYADKGWPVFPLAPRGKLPLLSEENGGHGYLDATTDHQKIEGWWRDRPDANIGVATGRASGIWVLDVDRHGGENGDDSLRTLQEKFGRLPDTVVQETPSGGHHRIFTLNGKDIRNRARIAPGLDVRGSGGYIVTPPSIHPNGKTYRWSYGADPFTTTLAPAPSWLENLAIKRDDPPAPTADRGRPPEAYASAAFGRIIGELSRAREGERNEALNKAAFAMGQFIGADALSRGQCDVALRSTALSLGLMGREVEATIKSGLDSGAHHPREMPREQRRYKARPSERNGYTNGEDEAPPQPGIVLEWLSDIVQSLETIDFVEGLLTTAGLSVIFGEPGCGKTFMALDLALHVAMGRPWFGRAVDQGGVVYVALEGRHGFRNRVAAARERYQLEDSFIPFAAITSTIDLMDPYADTPRLIAAIKEAEKLIEGPVRYVVIDTLSRALAGGDENSPEDMGALVMNAQRIIQETGAHVCFVHHSGKDRARGMRGHSILFGNIDTEIEIVRDEVTRIVTVKARKQRDLDLFDDFSFALQTVDIGLNARNKQITSCVVVPADSPDSDAPRDQLSEAERTILDQITEMIAAEQCHYSVVPESGMSSVTAIKRDDLRQWLVRHGFLVIDAKSKSIDPASRKRFQRGLESLREKHRIGAYNEWIWLP